MEYLANEKNVKVSGRSIYRDQVCYLGYSGSGISFRMHGTKAEVLLRSNSSDWSEKEQAWMAVFTDQQTEPVQRFCLDQESGWYTLYTAQEEADVTITLMKYSEAEFAVCGVEKIRIDGTLLEPPVSKARKIQCIGDSITCGYGIEDIHNTVDFHTSQENPYHAYAMLTANALDAEVQLVSWSGHGVISNYIDEESDHSEPDQTLLLPEQYLYTDASCSMQIFGETREQWERWDPARYQPDIVTVFLGTNDASYCGEDTDRQENFIAGYIKLLEEIRRQNPKADILCMLGTMDQTLCPAVKAAVARYNEKYGEQTEYLQLPMQRDEDGRGTNWHPSEITHRKTAQLVTEKIRQMKNW